MKQHPGSGHEMSCRVTVPPILSWEGETNYGVPFLTPVSSLHSFNLIAARNRTRQIRCNFGRFLYNDTILLTITGFWAVKWV